MPDFTSIDLVPLLYALVLGGLIGFERERRGRPAGLRTHALVCLSAAMLIQISHQVESTPELSGLGRVVFDPNRMGAGIVTGIGFLGAATVLRSGDVLRGLTTAACIWFVAGLGIVLGNGEYALGLFGTALVLLVLTAFGRFSHLMNPIIYRRLILIHGREKAEELTAEVRAVLERERAYVLDIASGHNDDGRHELVFYLSMKNEFQAPRLTERMIALEGVQSARWKLIATP